MITKDQVINAQTEWGNGVVKIGSLKENRSDCEKNFTNEFLDTLYNLKVDLFYLNHKMCI